MWVVQVNCGFGYGWEDVVESSRAESIQRLKEYRDNCSICSHQEVPSEKGTLKLSD